MYIAIYKTTRHLQSQRAAKIASMPRGPDEIHSGSQYRPQPCNQQSCMVVVHKFGYFQVWDSVVQVLVVNCLFVPKARNNLHMTQDFSLWFPKLAPININIDIYIYIYIYIYRCTDIYTHIYKTLTQSI